MSLLVVPLAIWDTPLEVPETVLLAVAASQHELLAMINRNRDAAMYREIRALPFYDEANS